MLYFVMFIIFMALIVGPIVAGKYLGKLNIPLQLLQPTGLNNNDTSNRVTGSALNGLGAAASASGDGGAAATSSSS